jgi:hypothetical protein
VKAGIGAALGLKKSKTQDNRLLKKSRAQDNGRGFERNAA